MKEFTVRVWSNQVDILSEFLPPGTSELFPKRQPRGIQLEDALAAVVKLLEGGFHPGFVCNDGPNALIKWQALSSPLRPVTSPMKSPVPPYAFPLRPAASPVARHSSPSLVVTPGPSKPTTLDYSSDEDFLGEEEDDSVLAQGLLPPATSGNILDFSAVPYTKIYKLERFLLNYVEDTENVSLGVKKDGSIEMLKKD